MSDQQISRSLRRLRDQGVHVWAQEGKLRFRAAAGGISEEQKAFLAAHRDEILALLGRQQDPGRLVPLTEIQSAYLVGRDDTYAYGSVGCHVYFELEYPRLDADAARNAWQALVERHEMLRAVIRSDGTMEILPEAPRVEIAVGTDGDRSGPRITEVRERLSHHKYPVDAWPFFTVELTDLPDLTVLHLDVDFMIADWASIWLLVDEFARLMAGETLPEVALTFREYLDLEATMRDGVEYDRDRAYWMGRVDTLPGRAQIPVLPEDADQRRFGRLAHELDAASWTRFQEKCRANHVTPTVALATVYGSVLAAWSEEPRFCISLTLLNRPPVHPAVDAVVGDFTSVSLLELDLSGRRPLVELAREVHRRMMTDLDHRRFSGVEVIREIARRRGQEAAFYPYVFTSSIGVVSHGASSSVGGYGRSETPQVFIDCQVMDSGTGLRINWDHRQGVFPDRVVEDMFEAMCTVVRAIADGSDWAEPLEVGLPRWQLESRNAANDTARPIESRTLLQDWLQAVRSRGEAPAIFEDDKVWSHAELHAAARRYGALLAEAGVTPGQVVATCGRKRGEQVAAILGILMAGGAYMPIDADQPATRRHELLDRSGAKYLLTDDQIEEPGGWAGTRILIDQATGAPAPHDWSPAETDPSQLAYVIHTSGSTGVPKGVMISHDAAWNTIADINHRYGIGPEDRVLALSRFSFDLSVYDLFGMLAAGGAVVLPSTGMALDASDWVRMIQTHAVTVWNTVPAMLELLVSHLERHPGTQLESLRTCLLSGDWVPVRLPGRARALAPNATVIALGGATEASIWSNHHTCVPEDEQRVSVPYGYPLANQGFRVVGPDGADRPVWVPGDLVITGRGLAMGLLNDEEQTAERFPTLGGTRCYLTGDRGRYLPNGEIEFLGRLDSQVKLRGFRVELAEIESAAVRLEGVARAAVVMCQVDGEQQLLAAVVPQPQTPTDEVRALGAGEVADALRSIGLFASGGGAVLLHGSGPDSCGALEPVCAAIRDAFPGVRVWARTGPAAHCEGFVLGSDPREQGIAPHGFDLVVTDQPSLTRDDVGDVLAYGGAVLAVGVDGCELRSGNRGRHPLRPDDVRRGLSQVLPAYMVPGQVQIVDDLPVGANQKIDRRTMAGWWVSASGEERARVEGVDDSFDASVRDIVESCLGRSGMGSNTSYYDYGADSLVLAQVAGRLRDLLKEESPGARVAFDAILRGLLDGPTLDETLTMVRLMRQPANETSSAVAPEGELGRGVIGRMIDLGGSGGEVVRLVPHAGLGTMNAFRFLNAGLTGQDLGRVIGFTVADVRAYCEIPTDQLIPQLGREYAQLVVDAGFTRVQLVGYCMGGFIAVEMARALTDKGVEVVDLTLIDSTPLTHEIEDSIVLESVFLPNFYLTIGDVFDQIDETAMMTEVVDWFQQAGGRLTAADVAAHLASPATPAARALAELDAMTRQQRFAAYTEVIERRTGQQLPEDMLLSYYEMYVHSFLSSAIAPEPYFGPVTYLQAAEPMDFLFADPREIIDFWQEAFLGGMVVEETPGNHITCVEVEENADHVVDRLGELLKESLEAPGE